MPRVKMIKTEKGADDGLHVVKYEAGKEYILGETLAKIFVNKIGCAVYLSPDPVPMVAEKDAGAAPMNKAVTLPVVNAPEPEPTPEPEPKEEKPKAKRRGRRR